MSANYRDREIAFAIAELSCQNADELDEWAEAIASYREEIERNVLTNSAPPCAGRSERMTGARMIAIERKRQVEEEGWDKEHDSQHTNGELAQAAAAYATPPKGGSGYFQDERIALFPNEWDAKWWKPCPDDRIRELVKAGALIAAEIDRLQRAAVRGKGE